MCGGETRLYSKGLGCWAAVTGCGQGPDSTWLVCLQGHALLRKRTATGTKGVTLNLTGRCRVSAFSVLLQLDPKSAELCLWSDHTGVGCEKLLYGDGWGRLIKCRICPGFLI